MAKRSLSSDEAINLSEPRISYAVDALRLALMMPPKAELGDDQERNILSPMANTDASAVQFQPNTPQPDPLHDDLMTRYIRAVEKQYHVELDLRPDSVKEVMKQGGDSALPPKLNQVVGMGENDEGVWFMPYPKSVMTPVEPLLQWELIRDTIALIKARRHGIPFGVYTSGILPDSEMMNVATELKSKVGLKHCIVTLGCSNPPAYGKYIYHPSCGVDSPQRAFQSVCSFIAVAAESGFPIEAAVLEGSDAGAASELAKSLGAVEVHTFPPIQQK
jgi:hypothetical protein